MKVYRLNILGKWKTEEVRAEILLLQVTTAQERKIKALLKCAIILKYAKTFTNHRVVTGKWFQLEFATYPDQTEGAQVENSL